LKALQGFPKLLEEKIPQRALMDPGRDLVVDLVSQNPMITLANNPLLYRKGHLELPPKVLLGMILAIQKFP
jgi:hypothetical protein